MNIMCLSALRFHYNMAKCENYSIACHYNTYAIAIANTDPFQRCSAVSDSFSNELYCLFSFDWPHRWMSFAHSSGTFFHCSLQFVCHTAINRQYRVHADETKSGNREKRAVHISHLLENKFVMFGALRSIRWHISCFYRCWIHFSYQVFTWF